MTEIISIHSFRGGTGKSNTTANLAVAIARMGKRVGIVDTDIQSPGIHILFGLDDEQMDRSLNDYLWGDCPIEDAAYDVGKELSVDGGELAVIGGGVYLVPSSIKVGEITRVLREGYDVGVLNDGFNALGERLELEYLLIDTHPGLNEETLLSITISNMLLVVLRPDQQDFQGTAVTVDVARKLEVPKILLVVNKALPDYDFDELRAEIEKTYDLPVAGILPLSEDVVRLASNGVFCVEEPDHPISKEVARIAERVVAATESAAARA
ncbi:MAG TPA: MinD/ParA family protein [Solirubrobacterales bacterium]|nr:MinD/ParA family protein [Solirubrobacterales bacterium]